MKQNFNLQSSKLKAQIPRRVDHFSPAEDVLISFPFTSKIFPTYTRGHSALAHISIVEFCSPLRISSGKAPGPRAFFSVGDNCSQ